MIELKPCPYCGAEGKIAVTYDDPNEDGFYIACTNPSCPVTDETVYATKEEAVDSWNYVYAIEKPPGSFPEAVDNLRAAVRRFNNCLFVLFPEQASEEEEETV